MRRRGEAEEREGRESERGRRVEREGGVGPCLLVEKGLGLRSLIFIWLNNMLQPGSNPKLTNESKLESKRPIINTLNQTSGID